MTTRAQKILRRTLVGGALAGGLTLLLTFSVDAGGEPRVALVGAIIALLAVAGSWEAVRMGPTPPVAPLPLMGAALLGCFAAQDWSGLVEPLGGLGPALRSLVLVAPLAIVLSARAGAAGIRANLVRAVWITPPLMAVLEVFATGGREALIVLILLSKIGDIAGYYVGSAIGKRHPFPRLSPGKTVAGCVGSLVAGVLAGLACAGGGLLEGLLPAAVLGGVLNVAAQAGDLLESWFKRTGGVKDSGVVFGPSGGVLDVVDSLLLTGPAYLAVAPLLFS